MLLSLRFASFNIHFRARWTRRPRAVCSTISSLFHARERGCADEGPPVSLSQAMEGRQPNKTTNTTERARMVWMWMGGQSARDIAQETGASVSTVYRWIRRWEQEGNIHTRPRTGKSQICLWRKKVSTSEPHQEDPYGGAGGFNPYFQFHYNLQPGEPYYRERQPFPSANNFAIYSSDNRE